MRVAAEMVLAAGSPREGIQNIFWGIFGCFALAAIWFGIKGQVSAILALCVVFVIAAMFAYVDQDTVKSVADAGGAILQWGADQFS